MLLGISVKQFSWNIPRIHLSIGRPYLWDKLNLITFCMCIYTPYVKWFQSREKGTNILGKMEKTWLPQDKCLHRSHGKLYIFGKKRFPSFRKYIVFHGYYGDIFLAVNMISLIFPILPSTLVPFSHGRNQICMIIINAFFILRYRSEIFMLAIIIKTFYFVKKICNNFIIKDFTKLSFGCLMNLKEKGKQ